jgi:hypothetical protein
MTSSHHHQLAGFFPNLFQNHPVYVIGFRGGRRDDRWMFLFGLDLNLSRYNIVITYCNNDERLALRNF